MPIPWEQIQPQPDEPVAGQPLALVTEDFVPAGPKPRRVPANTPLYIGARAAAHLFDSCLVLGASLYLAKALSLGFMALYASQLQALGSGAEDAFAETYEVLTGQLFSGCVAFLSVLYFVALPAVWARTPGLGLFGLKIVGQDGNPAEVRFLARRFLGCVLVYVSGGSLLVSSLRRRPSRLPQDSFSATCVVKASFKP